MTVVVASSSLLDGFVLADCQVAYPSRAGQPIYRDFCQKLFLTEYGVVVGIAGSVCLARFLASGLIEELNAREDDRYHWLNDGNAVYRFILSGIAEHLRRHPDHHWCRRLETSLLIVTHDYHRLMPDGTWVNGPPAPEMYMMELQWRRERLWYRNRRRGTMAIGRGQHFARHLHGADYEELVTHYGRYANEARQIVDAGRALLATHHLRKTLAETNLQAGVGGLYQVLTFGPYGVQTVPYFYLDHVAPSYGTYVAMRIDNGEWVQEHRPTNSIMRVKTPWDFDPNAPPRREMRFDSAARLRPDSPGVIARQNPEVTFSLYNPPEVPAAIQPSWGTDPLAPLTYAGRYRKFNGRPRWPGYE